MQTTMQLIDLQTYLLSKGETMMEVTGYKATDELIKIISRVWNSVGVDEQKYIEKLVAGTELAV